MTDPARDIWGRIYEDHHAGRRAPHRLERDDGFQDGFDYAAVYFAPAPRLEAERELLEPIEGPVLDLGAGAGSYALYLQERGVDVTAADASPGALPAPGAALRAGVRVKRAASTMAIPARTGVPSAAGAADVSPGRADGPGRQDRTDRSSKGRRRPHGLRGLQPRRTHRVHVATGRGRVDLHGRGGTC